MPSVDQAQERSQIQTQLPIAMETRGITATQLAAISGISYQTILKALRGETNLTKGTRIAICSALAISELWLLSYLPVSYVGGPVPMSEVDWLNHKAKAQMRHASRELIALRHGEVPPDLNAVLPKPTKGRRLDKIPGRPKDGEEQKLRKQLWGRRLWFIMAARKMQRNSIPGLSEQAVYNMLQGKQWPTHYTWKILSERFGLSVDQLQGLAPISAAEYLGQDIQDSLAQTLLKDVGSIPTEAKK